MPMTVGEHTLSHRLPLTTAGARAPTCFLHADVPAISDSATFSLQNGHVSFFPTIVHPSRHAS